ncbi:phosphatidate cytidylyltransferase [Alicyclobacillus fastidiosus]|uniref:Phosphatidate cytidylyltransferase n=1 Tax=Alicyclobacillus fastidiosus TaxID=392011 RepID=A0ABY6ZBE4_9BACL|nr:phosphatidate cytidylyltransferase [Alicyclobacillus fastidiosus]WAH40182.1 phosphatidate cytidylyltransferase [Alicyclobacillus fastidiosus]
MLKTRVITATIAGLVVLAVLVLGSPIAWRVLVWLCTVAGVVEFATMHRAKWYGPVTVYGVLLASVIEWFPRFFYQPFVLFVLVGIILAVPVFSRNRVQVQSMALQTIGALYIAVGGYAMGQLRAMPAGWFWLWLFLVAVWMTDTAAYFVGRFVQGPKLLPEISPKKTISGSLGGVVGGAIGAVVFGSIAHPTYDIWVYAVLGAVISVFGQLGDLIESAYKRAAGVKDSGKLLPGHGGMLDRVDSLLFASPFAFWIIVHGAHTWFQ